MSKHDFHLFIILSRVFWHVSFPSPLKQMTGWFIQTAKWTLPPAPDSESTDFDFAPGVMGRPAGQLFLPGP